MANSQLVKAISSGTYFVTGCLALVASQILGGPLYLVNEEWYNAWIALTKQSFALLTMTVTQCWAPTVVRVSGDKSVRGELLQLVGGGLLCDFPERMVLIANHQIYTDWLYLWWIAYTNGMHGRVYIVLKESLRRIPVIGWGMQLCQFIFLKRHWEKDKPHLAEHLQKLNKPNDPMWLILFPEGTNLASCTRQRSAQWAAKNGINDMRNVLLPRSTGLQFCLQQLRSTVPYVYDCTIAYEGVAPGQYAQDIFTIQSAYFQNRPPKSVNMYWRRFAVSSIPVDDSRAFELWLRARWMEKDALIDSFHRTGRFPADVGIDKTSAGATRRGAGYIENEIKAFHWYEFLQAFAPVGLLALILYTFYGALPSNFLSFIQRPAIFDKIKMFQKQLAGSHRKLLTGSEGKAWGNELFRLQKTAANIASTSTGVPTRKAITNGDVSKKALPSGPQAPPMLRRKVEQSAKPIPKPREPNKSQITSSALVKQDVKPVRKAAPPKLEIKSAIRPVAKLPPKKLGPKKTNPATGTGTVSSNSGSKKPTVGQQQKPAISRQPAKKPLKGQNAISEKSAASKRQSTVQTRPPTKVAPKLDQGKSGTAARKEVKANHG